MRAFIVARVSQAIASVLGVAEDARSPLREALARHVKDRTMLIVLVNFLLFRAMPGSPERIILRGVPNRPREWGPEDQAPFAT